METSWHQAPLARRFNFDIRSRRHPLAAPAVLHRRTRPRPDGDETARGVLPRAVVDVPSRRAAPLLFAGLSPDASHAAQREGS